MLPKCAQPHSLWYFSGRGSGRRALSFRLSRDVCDGTSNRKPATVAVNLLGPRRGGARAVGGVSPRGASRGRRSSSFHAASGRSSGPRHRELSRGYGDWLRCSDSSRSPHAPARSVPPWQGLVGLLAACAGRARRAEASGRWEAAPSAGSEPFEVRVLPEGCPVAGRPGAGAVRLPRQAPKKSRHTLVRGNNDII